ncbi:MAG TPA: tetratricopeptide repeat protein [Sphingomicrobium sp.]|nr:tetratricopeptide repeat protein [Sphingomicrobium sp.]
MAQPPDITDTFVREVDENLRRDNLRDFFRKYAGWLIATVVLFLAASGGWIYWQEYQRKQAEKDVEQLAQVYTDLSNGRGETAAARFDMLSKSRAKAVRASATFGRAAIAIQRNDLKLAAAKFGELANDKGMPAPVRDLALIRQTAVQFDSLKPEDVIARMAPLAKAGEPWFGSAGELTGLALIKQGKTAEAGKLFAAIARDETVPGGLRNRAVQMASSLGVDVSSITLRPAQ